MYFGTFCDDYTKKIDCLAALSLNCQADWSLDFQSTFKTLYNPLFFRRPNPFLCLKWVTTENHGKHLVASKAFKQFPIEVQETAIQISLWKFELSHHLCRACQTVDCVVITHLCMSMPHKARGVPVWHHIYLNNLDTKAVYCTWPVWHILHSRPKKAVTEKVTRFLDLSWDPHQHILQMYVYKYCIPQHTDTNAYIHPNSQCWYINHDNNKCNPDGVLFFKKNSMSSHISKDKQF